MATRPTLLGATRGAWPLACCAAAALLTLPSCSGDSAAEAEVEEASGRYRDYIRSDSYTKLVLEIDYMPGLAPAQISQDRLVAGLADLLDKPDGIEIVLDKELPARGADHEWTFAELDATLDANLDYEVDEKTVKIHTIFVDGHSELDDATGKVLGLSWGGWKLVVFNESVQDSCIVLRPNGKPFSIKKQDTICKITEHSVWIHEIGHLLGLVDNGLPMVSDHRDPDPGHGAHDDNELCVMYWANDRSGMLERIRDNVEGGEESSLGFDDACLADIAALRDAP